MKNGKSKQNFGLKKFIALTLIVTMLIFQTNLIALASNITGVAGVNGVYNIDPAKTSGTTGFRHYTNFTLDNGHTANLIFNGINRFINAVDNKVTINGILNSINGSGGFANGRAIFVSPNGFVVGSSGVVNVGSLGVYTPSTAAYNSFKNLDVSQMTDALLNSDQFYGQGNITINGMVLTREGMTLGGHDIDLNNSKIATGFVSNNAEYSQEAVAQISQSDIANARNNAGRLFELIVNGGQNGFLSSDIDFGVKNGNIAINGTGTYSTRNTTMVANGDVDVKMNNNNTTNSDSYDYNNVIGGKTYVANDFNFDSSVTETFVNSFNKRTSNKTNVVVLGEVNAKNISISNKNTTFDDLTSYSHNLGSYFNLAETGKLNAKETVNLENTGVQMALLGDINVDNQSNVEGAGVTIKNNFEFIGGANFGLYGSGDININNGDLNIIQTARQGGGIGFDKTANFNITNGDVNIVASSDGNGSQIYLLNDINIYDSGNLAVLNNSSYLQGTIYLNGNINLENGDVNVKTSQLLASDTTKEGHIYHYGTTTANGNINIESNSGSIIANGTITSTNNGSANYSGINIETTETSKGVLSVGGKLTSDKDINIVHNGSADGVSDTNRVYSEGIYFNFSKNSVNQEQEGVYTISSADKNEIVFVESFGQDSANLKDLYIADSAVLESKGVNGVVSLTRTGSEGGVNINGSIISAGGVDVINSGNRGIMFNNAINAAGTTFINDTGIADININNTITTGGLVVQNDNEGDINLTGTVNANGDVLVQNNTTGAINLAGTLNNGTTQGTTQIVNEANNQGGIILEGTLGAKNATTITNKGNSLINITGNVVDNVSGLTIEQTGTGANGGISIAKGITTDGYLTIDNKGQKGITLANGANTKSKGKTTIKDTSNVGINIGAKSTISAGSLEINKSGNGGINLDGTVNSTGDALITNSGSGATNLNNTFTAGNTTITHSGANGININGKTITTKDLTINNTSSGNISVNSSSVINSKGNVLVQNNTSGEIDISGTLNNSATSGTTKIVNESSNTGGINISGKVGAKNATTITNKGNSLINITGDVVDNVAGITVEQTNTGANGGIVIGKSVETDGDLTITNVGAKGITLNKTANTKSKGATTIFDTSNTGINTQTGSSINAGLLTVEESGNGLISLSGEVTSSSDATITNTGANGGISISGNVVAEKDLSITNSGQKGITLAEGGNTTSKGATTIFDTSNTGINTQTGSSINAGLLTIEELGNGGIDLAGTVNSTGDTLVVNYGTDSINISNTFAGGKTTIYNDVNGKDINISDAMTTNGETMIVQGGSGILNITNTLKNNSQDNTIISNVNGTGLNVANINTNGFTLLENSGKGNITINGNINANNGDLSIQNQNYQIAINKTNNNNSNLVSLARKDANSTNKDGGIVAKGNLSGNKVYVQNSGANGITTSGDITAAKTAMITTDNGSINLKTGTVTGGNVVVSASKNAVGGIEVNNVTSQGVLLLENASKGDIVINGNLNGNDGFVLVENQTYDIVTPRASFNNDYIVLDVNRMNQDALNKDGGIVANGSILGGAVYLQNSGSKGISTSNDIVAYDVMITNNDGSINLNDGSIFGDSVIISNSNNANALNVNADVEAISLALVENAGSGDINIGGDVSGSLVSIQNQTYDIETPRIADGSFITLDVNRIDKNSPNSNGGITTSGNITGGEVYIQNSGTNGITTSGDIQGTSNVTVTNNSGNINLSGGTINSSNVIVSNSNKANELKVDANIQSNNGIVLLENAGSGNMTVNGNINGNSIVLLENQTYDIITPRISGSGLIMLDVNRIDSQSANTNSELIANGDISGNIVYIQNSGANGITTNSNITSQGDVMITNNGGNMILGEGNILGENVIVSNSNQAGALTSNSNINALNLALIENAGNGDMTVNGNVSGALVSLQNQTYDISTPRVVTQSNGLITLGVNRSDSDSANKGNALVTNGTLTGQDVYVQNSGNGGIKSNSDIQAQYDVMITNNGGSINLESGNISGTNVTVSNSNQANGGIIVGANVNTERDGKLVVENAAPGSITLNGDLNSNGGYIIIENQTYDIETPRVVYGDFILLDVNRINQPSQYIDGGIIANGTINGGDVFIQNAGSQGITINNDIVSDNLMVTNDNGGINIGNINITAQHRDIIISNSSNATNGINIAANVEANSGDVVVENSGNGNIELTETSSLTGQRVLVENQTYDIETPRNVSDSPYITLDVNRIDTDSLNRDGGIIANGNINGTNEVYIQNSGNNGITTNGDVTGGNVAITNNGGSINLNNGTISGNEVIVSQSNQGEGGVTIGSNISGNDFVLIENAGSGDIAIGGNIDGTKISIQNQTYDIETPRNVSDSPYITLDVNRIDTDSPNRDGGIVIDGDVNGTEDIKIQNSGDDGITTNGDVQGGDVTITNNGGDVNVNGDVDGDDVTISNSDNGGEVNINGNVDGNDVLVENNGNGNINNPGNVNGDVKDHEYGIETPRNTDDAPYITLDVNRRPFPPGPTPDPNPNPNPNPNNNISILRDNDPTRLIYDREEDSNFLELKRESIRYGVNGDSLSLGAASEHIQNILDISKTGLAVKTDGGLKLNDEVKISFAYKGIEVEATAKVMRVNQSTNVAGLKFTDLDNLTANKILYLSMLNEAQKEQTVTNNQNQEKQPSFMNILSKM